MDVRRVGDTEVVIVGDEQAVAREAAERTAGELAAAIERRGEAHLAMTGGSSAIALYRELAQPAWRPALDWENVHLWWGDERFVPTDHPESNAGLAYRLLMAWSARAGESGTGGEGVDVTAGDVPGLAIRPEHVHPIPMEATIGADAPPMLAAQRYAEQLGQRLPQTPAGVPVFDVVHLGVGPDGHVMSVFPGSPALAADAPIALAIAAPEHVEPQFARVTLAARVLPAARLVLVMVSGDAKAEVVAEVLGPERDVHRWPAQAALLPNAVWLLDEEAASLLRTG